VYDGFIELSRAMSREMHPNSLKALAEAQQARRKGAKRVNMTLTPEAIASLDAKAQKEGISRSELIERYARSLMEGKYPRMRATPEEQLEKNQPAIEWAKARIEEAKEDDPRT
jgi:purine nucleoside phosphorylase